MTIIKTALLATTLTAFAVPAAAAEPVTAAERDARIDALQAQLNAIAAELATLRAAAPAATATASATTPAPPPRRRRRRPAPPPPAPRA